MEGPVQRHDGDPASPAAADATVTLTLPQKTLQALHKCDRDLARAVVRVTDRALAHEALEGSSFEIVELAAPAAVVVVGARTRLTQIPWVRLVQIAPGRNLIAIPTGTSLEALEIAVLELIEGVPAGEAVERSFLKAFSEYVGRLRRHGRFSRAEILIVDSEAQVGDR